MANQINVSISSTATVDSYSGAVRSSVNTQTTSSNAFGGSVAINNATWININTGSCSDIRNITVVADNSVYSSSVVALATAVDGSPIISYFRTAQGDGLSIPYSGSTFPGLWAKIVAGTDTVGTLQYVVQQS